ncbi:MAG: sigma-70 family RNA polymerase sigma factor [Desulfobacteraceae bacterium]|jgi:RNA polymerase sigma factor (sigma-70 family)
MNTYTQYFAEINRAKMPANAEEERLLFKRYLEQGDMDARRLLIEGGLRFVIKIARRYSQGDAEILHNLISAGNIGLITAVDRYRPWVIQCSCGNNNYLITPNERQQCQKCNKPLLSNKAKHYTTRFLTYAAWWIIEAIHSAIYEASLVHIPPYKQKEYYRERRAGRDNGISYFSYETIVPPSSIHQLINEFIKNSQNEEENYAKTHVQNLLYSLLHKLKDRHAYIIIAYYGLREESKTLREIATKLNICPERVRQIKEDALKQLRLCLEEHNIANIDDICWN